MLRRDDRGQANLTAIVILLGIIITSVWVWKRLSLDTQEYAQRVGKRAQMKMIY